MFNDVCDPQRSNLLRRVAVDGGIRRIIITNSYIDESIRLDATLFCTSAVIKNLRVNKEHGSIPTITTINYVELGRIQNVNDSNSTIFNNKTHRRMVDHMAGLKPSIC